MYRYPTRRRPSQEPIPPPDPDPFPPEPDQVADAQPEPDLATENTGLNSADAVTPPQQTGDGRDGIT